MRRLTGPRAAALAAVLAVPGGSRPADAQNALGGGNALDANTLVGSGGRNTPADAFVDTRVRNLLVTGNVPAGREFRGVVGYTAPGDFRGEVGGDDQYAFRRDSAFSAGSLSRLGPAFDALRFGGRMDQTTYRRDFTVTDAVNPGVRDTDAARARADALRLDTLLPAMERATEPALETRPGVVGVLVDPGGTASARIVEASTLRGLQALQGAEQRSALAGLSVYDRLRLEEDAARGLDVQAAGEPFTLRFTEQAFPAIEGMSRTDDPASRALAETQRVDTLNPASRQETRVAEATPEAGYETVLVRIAERYAQRQNVQWNLEPRLLEVLDEDYKALRDALTGVEEPTAGPLPVLPPADDPDAEAKREETLRRLLPSRRGSGDDTAGKAGDLERFGSILRHGARVEHLVTDQDRGRFEQLVRGAEEQLAAGEYFWAERRFVRALRFVPGHPLATAGLGHAQLGAGLYRSSALTLRSLLSARPEMIGVRYDATLLPNSVRLAAAVEEIRTRGVVPGQENLSGFLLAYIGHQTGDATLVADGLDTMATDDPDDPLLPVLRGAWREDGPR